MKINCNTLNNTVFGSIYKFNITDCDSQNCTLNEFEDKQISDYEGFKIFTDFPSIREIEETGVFEKIHISADDKYDKFIESLLTQNNINFKKQTHKNALLSDAIYKRIVLSENAKYQGKNLVSLDVNQIDALFKKDIAYISYGGREGSISTRYQDVKDYLATGRDIDATEAILSDNNGELSCVIIDGRHRFAVMRDIGMDKIKMALNDESLKIAKKYGLIK